MTLNRPRQPDRSHVPLPEWDNWVPNIQHKLSVMTDPQWVEKVKARSEVEKQKMLVEEPRLDRKSAGIYWDLIQHFDEYYGRSEEQKVRFFPRPPSPS